MLLMYPYITTLRANIYIFKFYKIFSDFILCLINIYLQAEKRRKIDHKLLTKNFEKCIQIEKKSKQA